MSQGKIISNRKTVVFTAEPGINYDSAWPLGYQSGIVIGEINCVGTFTAEATVTVGTLSVPPINTTDIILTDGNGIQAGIFRIWSNGICWAIMNTTTNTIKAHISYLAV